MGRVDRAVRGAAALLGVALLASCSGSTPPTAASRSSGTAAPAGTEARSGAPDPQPGALTWKSCQEGLECASLAVPLDYADPTGTLVTLAVIRRPARDQAQRIGSLVVNPGGPGGSGLAMVRGGYGTGDGLNDRFDVVSWDPRGIGLSQPLDCGSSAPTFEALDPDPPDAAGQAALDQAAQAIASDCATHAGPLLDHMDTDTTARDLEQLRRALGDPKLTYAGYSYGTAIGLAYADRYPNRIRAMVIDGVVPPDADLVQLLTAQTNALDQSLRAMFTRCDADRSCPVRDAGDTYDALARRLVVHRMAAGPTTIGPSELATAAGLSTYDPAMYEPFMTALHHADQGDGAGIAAMAHAYHTEIPSYAGYVGVLCVDRPHPVGAAAYQAFAGQPGRSVAPARRLGGQRGPALRLLARPGGRRASRGDRGRLADHPRRGQHGRRGHAPQRGHGGRAATRSWGSAHLRRLGPHQPRPQPVRGQRRAALPRRPGRSPGPLALRT